MHKQTNQGRQEVSKPSYIALAWSVAAYQTSVSKNNTTPQHARTHARASLSSSSSSRELAVQENHGRGRLHRRGHGVVVVVAAGEGWGGAVRAGGVEVLPGETGRRWRRGRDDPSCQPPPLPRRLLPLQADHLQRQRHLHVQRRRGVLRRGVPAGADEHGRGAAGGVSPAPPPAAPQVGRGHRRAGCRRCAA